MSEFDTDSLPATKSGVDISADAIDEIVNDVFVELKAGRATVQSRPRNYYEVRIPFDVAHEVTYSKLNQETLDAIAELDEMRERGERGKPVSDFLVELLSGT
jgi:hypothetical protein